MDGMARVLAAILNQEVTVRRKLHSRVVLHTDRSWVPDYTMELSWQPCTVDA